jgi:two-component system, LytTR family, sensor kinase
VTSASPYAAPDPAPSRATLRSTWLRVVGVCVLIATGTVVQRCLGTTIIVGTAHVGDEVMSIFPRYLIRGALTPLVWVLAERFPLAGRGAGRHVLVHVAGWLVYVTAQVAAFTVAEAAFSGWTAAPRPAVFGMVLLGSMPYDTGLYLGVLGVYHAVRYHRAYVARAVKDAQLETRLAQAELDALRAHLQPGFLFRSLDAIARLMEADVRRARKALADLSELLRLSLNEGGGQPVPLGEELELLQRYFAVRALGTHGAPRLRLQVEDGERALLVAPALLQPIADALLEGSTRDGRAVMEVRARRDGERLHLEIAAPSARTSDGDAIAAASARLERVYGGGASLHWENSGARSLVQIDLPATLSFSPVPVLT